MNREGPLLETLTRRLAGCPAEFLALPRVGETGNIHVDAVVADLLRDLGGEGLPAAATRHFQSRNRKADRARLSLALLACWLLHDEWFVGRPGFADPALRLLSQGLSELAATTAIGNFVADPDRREELARLCLRELGLRPRSVKQVARKAFKQHWPKVTMGSAVALAEVVKFPRVKLGGIAMTQFILRQKLFDYLGMFYAR